MQDLPPWLPADASLSHRAQRLGVRLVQTLRAHHAPAAASAMAYSFFLGLIPLFLLVGYVLGHFVRVKGVDAVLGPVLDAAPDGPRAIIQAEAERLATAQGAGSMAPLAAGGFLLIASSGVHGLMNVLELTSRGERRAWWKKRALALFVVFAGVATITAGGVAVVKIGFSKTATATRVEAVTAGPSASRDATHPASAKTAEPVRKRARFVITPTERHLLSLSAFLLGIVGVAAFYRISVHRAPSIRRRVWPGALLAMATWVLVTWGFGAYVTGLGRYHLYYGGLAAIAIMLFWFWLTALALLLGAELNAQLEGVRDAPVTTTPRI